MGVSKEVQFVGIEDLFLDPMNPRLGRHEMNRERSQDDLLRMMRSWVLDELAWSFLESGGFWTHEPLMVVEEDLYGESALVVVEGNRRLAALKTLHNSVEDAAPSKKWSRMVNEKRPPPSLFEEVPYILADSRKEVSAFLGFRHVTGIKQWKAEEKAEFIATLIDESELGFAEVARKIGSKTPTVRKHYAAFRVLLEMEEVLEEFDEGLVSNRFSPLYMALGTQGVQDYLDIALEDIRERSSKIIGKKEKLGNLYRWLFVPENGSRPLVRDTRVVTDFGRILEEEVGVKYLENTRRPNLERALELVGGNEEKILQYLRDASGDIKLALGSIHQYKQSALMRSAVAEFGRDAKQLMSIFPGIKKEIDAEE